MVEVKKMGRLVYKAAATGRSGVSDGTPSQRGRGDLSVNRALMPLAPCLEKGSAESRTNNSSLGKQQEKSMPRHSACNTEGWIWVWFWL